MVNVSLNRFAILGCIGYGSLAISAVAFLTWASSGSSQPGESWDAWNARIDRLWYVVQAGLAAGGVAGLAALVVPGGGRRGRLIAAVPALGAASLVFLIYRVVTSLQIR